MAFPDPTWARLGFMEPPDFHNSGHKIGVLIIDKMKPHHTIRHLGDRMKYVTVENDLTINCNNIAFQSSGEEDEEVGEHGLMTILTLSHQPFFLEGKTHVGLSPAANFIVLDHGAFREGESERLKYGMDWVLKQPNWNIKIILCTGWHASDNPVLLQKTHKHSTVQALNSAVERGLMVICSNGNTRLGNIMPPIEYFTVGGFNDRGKAERHLHLPYPDEPFGKNGDGHFRPDILAPRVYLTLPFCESKEREEQVSYYWGTSGAAALVTGIAAYLFSKYPDLDSKNLRSKLIENADPIEGYKNNAPRINVGNVIHSLEMQVNLKKANQCVSCVRIAGQDHSIESSDDIERGLALSKLVQQQNVTRQELWKYAEDESDVIRKIAVYALAKPEDEYERSLYWKRLSEESEGGVRGWYAHGLLQNTNESEVSKWIPCSTDSNWAVRWSVSEYLARYAESFPQLEKTHDPDLIQEEASKVLLWLKKSKDLL
ncbi:S8 family serine peptidase [Paenibacillus sp. CC-CFT742]|nr:S8 family serine peptidase [Paenibacillus sp. CC-CFT742]WJH29109.1 S8 family serine peptidase [Paenibacillus sp. CC-CFT742]